MFCTGGVFIVPVRKAADERVSAAFVVAVLSFTPVEVFLLPLALTALLSLTTVV